MPIRQKEGTTDQDAREPASMMELLSQQGGMPDTAAPPLLPTGGESIPSRGGETPRESPQGVPTTPSAPKPGELHTGTSATPPMPTAPTPAPNGSTFNPISGGNSVGPLLSPMSSQRRGLYGALGGLKGGGLGVPLDPTSNQASDPISGLISMLESQLGKRGGY